MTEPEPMSAEELLRLEQQCYDGLLLSAPEGWKHIHLRLTALPTGLFPVLRITQPNDTVTAIPLSAETLGDFESLRENMREPDIDTWSSLTVDIEPPNRVRTDFGYDDSVWGGGNHIG
jgi:hypothetical protein